MDVYLNYIGQFEAPEEYDGLTDTEREDKKAVEAERARKRKYHREWAARNKEKKRLQVEQQQLQNLSQQKTA